MSVNSVSCVVSIWFSYCTTCISLCTDKHRYVDILAFAAGQPLFSVILSQSVNVCPQIFAVNNSVARLWVYAVYFSVYFVGVTNVSSHSNLYPAVEIYRRHRCMRFSGASQKDYWLVVALCISSSYILSISLMLFLSHLHFASAVISHYVICVHRLIFYDNFILYVLIRYSHLCSNLCCHIACDLSKFEFVCDRTELKLFFICVNVCFYMSSHIICVSCLVACL